MILDDKGLAQRLRRLSAIDPLNEAPHPISPEQQNHIPE
jgi:hypothetical protein